jgi:outer membrane lipase/esterase
MANYLAAAGGHANSKALYLVSSGGNDITFAQDTFGTGTAQAAYVSSQAVQLANAITALQAAGARYIVVPGSYGLGNLANIHTQTVWTTLANNGVQFVPADLRAMRQAIIANPTAFGFTAATVSPGVVVGVGPTRTSTGSACTINDGGLGPNAGWGQWCINSTSPSTQHAYLASADAQQRYLFADDQHFSAAGQKIEADYIYSLLVAPSQISFLAENAVKAGTRLASITQNQIETSQTNRGPSGVNAWVTGDVSHLSMDNYNGFPDDPSTPVTLTAGIDVKVTPQILVGALISVGTQRSSFSTTGDFTQDEVAGGLYAAYRGGPWWGNILGAYGHLDYNVNRNVPIGISVQLNNGNTSGSDWLLATEGGYKFHSGPLTHGPVAGLTLQRVNVSSFTETGSFTSLAFGDQTRDSVISALGYRASFDWGMWRPFAQVVWNHEFADTDRNVTAWLTTTTAPGYSLPAVDLGHDWATASVGTTIKLGAGVTMLGALTAEFGQSDVNTYGAQLGLNIAF